jgi:anti-anti-sigma regulatory factor
MLRWTRTATPNGMRIALVGEINEESQLLKLAEELSGTVVLDLSDVTSISSFGILQWKKFIDATKGRVKAMTLERCSPQVCLQMSMVPNLLGFARIASAHASYYCDCGAEAVRLIQFNDTRSAQLEEEFPCADCGKLMELDELPQTLMWLSGVSRPSEDTGA